jgi:hypothetical protein
MPVFLLLFGKTAAVALATAAALLCAGSRD